MALFVDHGPIPSVVRQNDASSSSPSASRRGESENSTRTRSGPSGQESVVRVTKPKSGTSRKSRTNIIEENADMATEAPVQGNGTERLAASEKSPFDGFDPT